MADYKTAVLITIDMNHEGGYQCDSQDHANWSSGKIGEGVLMGTKYGITALDMPGVIIKDLTTDQAIDFYRGYWKTGYSDINDQPVANKLFDMGVLFGIGEAVGIMQVTVSAHEDFAFGPATLEAINQVEPVGLLQAYKTNLITHAFNVAKAKPEERKFLAGWGRRINS